VSRLRGCGHVFGFIWGWQNADSLDASNPPVLLKYKQWIMVWTGCIIANIVLNVAVQGLAAASR
jgi:hypothetical protein